MENVGTLAVLLAFCISIYAIVSSVVGRLKRRPFLLISGERAVYAVWFLITCATGILVYNFFIRRHFTFAYVAARGNRDMQGLYKFAALWGLPGRLAAVPGVSAVVHLRGCRRSSPIASAIARLCRTMVSPSSTAVQTLARDSQRISSSSPFQMLADEQGDHLPCRTACGLNLDATVSGDGHLHLVDALSRDHRPA